MEFLEQHNDGEVYPGDSTARSSRKRPQPQARGVEQLALVQGGHDPFARSDKGKRAEGPARKANGSPYAMANTRRPKRENASRTPQEHKPVSVTNFYGPAAAPSSRPTHRPNPHRIVSGPSRTPAQKTEYREIDDESPLPPHVRSSVGRGAGDEFMDQFRLQPTRHERSTRAPDSIFRIGEPGPSSAGDRNRRNSEPIHVVSDDEDGAADGEMESRPPPAKSSPLNYARARHGLDQPLRPRGPPPRAKQLSHSGDDGEGVDDIESFSQETPPDVKGRADIKGKGRVEPEELRAPRHVVRAKMQKKDGTTLPPPKSTRPAPAKSRTTAIPSSNIELTGVAPVQYCFADDDHISLDITNMGVSETQLWLCVGGGQPRDMARIQFDMERIKAQIYVDDVPMFRFVLSGSKDFKNVDKLNNARVMHDDRLVSGTLLDIALKPSSQSHEMLRLVRRYANEEPIWTTKRGREYFHRICNGGAVDRSQTARAAEARARLRPSAAGGKAKQAGGHQSTIQFPHKSAVKNVPQTASTSGPSGVRRSGRITSTRTSTPNSTSRDDTSDIDEIPPPVAPPPDRNELLFHYGSLDITKGERYRFGHDFLNDTCLEFGLRYTLDKILPKDVTDSVHCFNSFFYEKLSKKERRKAPEGEWPAYDSVRRWTKKADIFNKKYIIVPVNESLHWYLAVVYNPRGILPETLAVPPVSEQPVKGSNEASPVPSRPLSAAASVTSDSFDPINAIDQPDVEMARTNGSTREDADVRDVRSLVDDMDLDAKSGEAREMDVDEEEEEEPIEWDAPQDVPPPQPIMSDTLAIFNSQGQPPVPARDSPASDGKATPTEPTKPSGRQPSRPDKDILGSNGTWIFTFDSLGGRHAAVANNLSRWLHHEARDKLGVTFCPRDPEYLEGRVPTQPNFSDCGLYLIHFMERLLSHSPQVLEFIGKAPRIPGVMGHEEWARELKTVWDASKVSGMREHWVDIVDIETSAYRQQRGKSAGREASPPAVDASQASVQVASQPPRTKVSSEPPQPQQLPAVPEGGEAGAAPHRSSDDEEQLDRSLDAADVAKTPPESPVVNAPRRKRVIPDTPHGAAPSQETAQPPTVPESPLQHRGESEADMRDAGARFPVSDDSDEGTPAPVGRQLSVTSIEGEQDELDASSQLSDPMEAAEIPTPGGRRHMDRSAQNQLAPVKQPLSSSPGAKDDPFTELGTRSAPAKTSAHDAVVPHRGRARGQPGIVRPADTPAGGPSTTPTATATATRARGAPSKVLVPGSSPAPSASPRSTSPPAAAAKRSSDDMERDVSSGSSSAGPATKRSSSTGPATKRARQAAPTLQIPPVFDDDDSDDSDENDYLRLRGITPPPRRSHSTEPSPSPPRATPRRARQSTPHPSTSKPRAEASTSKPRAEASTSKPRAEASTSKPHAEPGTSKSRAKSKPDPKVDSKPEPLGIQAYFKPPAPTKSVPAARPAPPALPYGLNSLNSIQQYLARRPPPTYEDVTASTAPAPVATATATAASPPSSVSPPAAQPEHARRTPPKTYKRRKRNASGTGNERSAKRRHDHAATADAEPGQTASAVAATAAAAVIAGRTPETSIAVVDDSD